MSRAVRWRYHEALAWLETHVNLEAVVAGRPEPSLDRIRHLCGLMGDPQSAFPVIHVTGTNGKGSTAKMTTALLAERGLAVGTYTSPDLEGVNERLALTQGHIDAFEEADEDEEEAVAEPGSIDRTGVVRAPADGTAPTLDLPTPVMESIADDDLAAVLEAVAGLEGLLDSPLTRFEILTAAAYRWFADVAVDVAVVEVGLGGLYDATNVADGDVAVVTNVSLDHGDILGPLEGIAREKAGIVKPGSALVLGEISDALAPVFREAGAEQVWELGRHFGVTADRAAVGGRLVTLRTPTTEYEDVFLPVHGAHQATNAALALAAAEAFFGGPLPEDVVTGAFGGLRLPGRMEVMGRHPLVLLDGAHNVAGARAAAATVAEEFAGEEGLIAVVGMLQGKDPTEMLVALGLQTARLVVACPAPSPRSLPAAAVAAAARSLGVDAVEAASVAEAVEAALDEAGEDDRVLVTGSLYVVGAARTALRARPSDVGEEQAGQ
ncbi:MAG: bifunctional folylpolyglutamate synthase/dihydrofolate synthase [Acidimicrobiales bacterium]